VRGGATIDAGEYIILADDSAKFISDNSSYGGKVFDSSFSLSNSGESLSLKDSSLNIISTVNYNVALGAAGNGNTICDVSGVWAECQTTPGAINSSSNNSSNNNSTTTNSTSTDATTTTASTTTNTNSNSNTYSNSFSIPDSTNYRYGNLDIKALRERSVIAGGEYVYSAKAFNYEGQSVSKVQYFYSFGDGGGRESQGDAKYIYGYPGEYELNIEGSTNDGQGIAIMHVYVTRPDIVISEIGQSEAYIKLHNKTSRDLDLSNYIIDNGNGYFKIAKNTKIKSSGDLTLSGLAMGFGTSSQAKLLFPNMKEVTSYTIPRIVTPALIIASAQVSPNVAAAIQEVKDVAVLSSPSNLKNNLSEVNSKTAKAKTLTSSVISKSNLDQYNSKQLVKYVYKSKIIPDVTTNNVIKNSLNNEINTTSNNLDNSKIIDSGEKTLAERLKLWLYK
jgi:hypothetical protein